MEARNGKLLLQDRPTDIDDDSDDDDDDDDNNNDDNEETDDDDDDDKEEEKEEGEQKEDCGYDDKREDDDNEKKKAKKRKRRERKAGRGEEWENKKSLRNDEEGNSIDKNNTRHTFFSFDTFRRRPLLSYDVKCPNVTFYGGRGQAALPVLDADHVDARQDPAKFVASKRGRRTERLGHNLPDPVLRRDGGSRLQRKRL